MLQLLGISSPYPQLGLYPWTLLEDFRLQAPWAVATDRMDFLIKHCAALSYICSTYFLVFAICLFAEHNRHFQFFFQLLDALLVSSDTILEHLSTAATQSD